MTLFQIIQILKEIALSQPNIRTTTDGSVYDALNTNPAIQYDVFHISQTNHREDENYDYYGFNLFYISRLEDSLEDNRLQIQSIGKEILSNIIRSLCENWSIDYPTITYFPFTQRFNDLCAGVYCSIQLDIPKEIWCADDYIAEVVPGSGIKLQDIGITITQNGLIVITPDAEYDGIGEIRIETNVPQSAAVLQDKEVEYTENGSYSIHPDPAYDGLSSVSVDVLVPDRYDEGYDDGKEDGEAEQKAKLTVTSFTENNTYTRENGWSAVTVDVDDRYDEGYADGKEDGKIEQKAELTVTSFTENNTYTRENGWSAVTVDVPSDYQDGYDDGVADQKAKLSSILVTENSVYYREDGWSALTVEVPNDYQAGYDAGFAAGEANQKSKMVATAITENGEYGRPDGYSAITVAVPQTGTSNEDLIANLQGDYYLIPYGTTHLRNYVFYKTCFSSITIPSSVSAIGEYAFSDNTCLTSITIPDSVQSLGRLAFSGCTNLQTAILGNGLTELKGYTFFNCYSLTGITIPPSIDNIQTWVFGNCYGLTEMTFEGLTPPTIDTGNSLGSTAYTFPIYVPCQSIDAYRTAFGTAYAPRIQCREQEMITAITLNVSSAITDSGTATTTYSPLSAYADIYYTSSNPSIATIDPDTGVITVVVDGNTTICTNDRISGLQDCKTVAVSKTPPGPAIIPYTADTSTVAATGETRCVTIDTTGLNTSTIGLLYTGATGLTYVINGNQICITFPENLELARSFEVKITASTLQESSAYADITFQQSPVDYQNKWLKVTYYTGAGTIISNGKGSYDMITDGVKLVKTSGTTWNWTGTTRRTLYFHLTGNTIKDEEFYMDHYTSPDLHKTTQNITMISVVVPSGVTSIGSRAIAGQYVTLGSLDYTRYSGLTSIVLPNSVTSFGEGAFENNVVLKSIQLPSAGPTIIPKGAFGSAGVRLAPAGGPNVIIPSNVRTIKCDAFHTVHLNSITFPAGLVEMEDCNCCGVFQNAKILKITFNGTTPPTLGCGTLGLTNTDYTICVPSSAVNTYKAAWPNYADKITAITS